MAKLVGKVKWFDNAKGFGFILNDDNEDVFVHYRSIMAEGYKSLNEGEEVSFIQTRSDKGWQAAEVERTGNDEPSDGNNDSDQQMTDEMPEGSYELDEGYLESDNV